jgi:hypothetical protein
MTMRYIIRFDCDGIEQRPWCGENVSTVGSERPDVMGARRAIREAGWRITPLRGEFGTAYRYQCPRCIAEQAEAPTARHPYPSRREVALT